MNARQAWLSVGLFLACLLWVGSARAQSCSEVPANSQELVTVAAGEFAGFAWEAPFESGPWLVSIWFCPATGEGAYLDFEFGAAAGESGGGTCAGYSQFGDPVEVTCWAAYVDEGGGDGGDGPGGFDWGNPAHVLQLFLWGSLVPLGLFGYSMGARE